MLRCEIDLENFVIVLDNISTIAREKLKFKKDIEERSRNADYTS